MGGSPSYPPLPEVGTHFILPLPEVGSLAADVVHGVDVGLGLALVVRQVQHGVFAAHRNAHFKVGI